MERAGLQGPDPGGGPEPGGGWVALTRCHPLPSGTHRGRCGGGSMAQRTGCTQGAPEGWRVATPAPGAAGKAGRGGGSRGGWRDWGFCFSPRRSGVRSGPRRRGAHPSACLLFPAGLWLYLAGSSLPCLTLIGSPNFGYRSVHRDLEAQIAIVTESQALQQQLHQVGGRGAPQGSGAGGCSGLPAASWSGAQSGPPLGLLLGRQRTVLSPV